MHSYAPWSAAFRRTLLRRLPGVEAQPATTSRHNGLCLRLRSIRRHIYLRNGTFTISRSRQLSTAMVDEESMLMRSRAVLSRLLSLPNGSRSTSHLDSLLRAAEQADSESPSELVRITGMYSISISNKDVYRRISSVWTG